MSKPQARSTMPRRIFLAGAAATAAVTIVKPSLVRGTEANSTVEVGLIGCGGRGNWITKLFSRHGKYRWVACCDYYPDHADRTGNELEIMANRRYSGLSGYKKLVESKLDAVVIESPPYFHPEQAAAAVDAGKHVFVAKPVAVDVPGCKTIASSGQKASDRKLVFLIDFQTRANEHFQRAAQAIHSGEIGRIVCAEARYPWGVGNFPGPATPHDTLRRWYCIKALSGDFIVEQNIHAIDVAAWFLNADPVRAVGVGGSKKLRSYGDIWDHFAVIYTFPNNVNVSFSGNQCTPGATDEIPCRVYGSRATVDTDYFSRVWLRGDPKLVKPFEAEIKGLYDTGAANNIRDFHKNITEGNYKNETVAQGVRSNLCAVMGRDACYKGEPVTWDQFIASDERLEPDLKGFKS